MRSGYIRRRLGITLIAAFGASLLLYALTHVIPGDPIRALFGFRPPPPELLAEIRGHYGLDDPFYVQYLKFMRNALMGDFGYSTRGDPVRSILWRSLPVSLRLIAFSFIFQVVIGVGAGVVTAWRGRSPLGRTLRGTTMVVVAVPMLALGFVLQAVFGYGLRWLPPIGTYGGWPSYILPGLALALGATAHVARVAGAEISDSMAAPYTATHRALGIGDRRLAAVHALKASLATIIALIAANTAQMIAGLIIVEPIFGLPGLGSAVLDAIRWKDHNVIVAVLALFVVANLILSTAADLLSGRIDPRFVVDG